MPIRSKFGIAVDIGTTNVIIHLVDLDNDHLVNQLLMKNPQIEFGADVISRIRQSRKSNDRKEMLVFQIRNTIRRGILGVLEERRLKPSSVSDIVIVGNTVMHHFFFDLSTESLTRPPYRVTNKEAISTTATELGLEAFENAMVYSPPVVESFIGPDAVAVLLASGFLEKSGKRLTIDVGTNTEISVITPNGIWIASAASGPAFEGMSIECGIGGEIGAIQSVSIDRDTFRPTLSIIGDGNPRGICGTGAISLIASLLESNLLLPRGSFNREIVSKWFSLDSDVAYYLLAPRTTTSTGNEIILTQPDLRMLQQSKAAIRAAIEIVLKKSSTKPEEITELFLTGVFGSDLIIENAYRIGMLPCFPNASITQSRNGAIQGAELLLKRGNRGMIEELVSKLNYIELTESDEFKQVFLESLPFPSK